MGKASDLLNGGGSSFPFGKPGDSIAGTVLKVDVLPQTDVDSGETLYWDVDKTRVKQMILAVVQSEPKVTTATDERGKAITADDGKWNVFFSGHKFTALQRATQDLNEGDWIKVTFDGFSDRPPKTRGHNPAKLYGVEWRKGSGATAILSPTGAAPAPSDSAEAFGPRPDTIPQAAWDVMPPSARAAVSPPVVDTSAAHGPKPDYLPQAAWDAMDAATRAQLAPPVAQAAAPALIRPAYIPEAAWNLMDADSQAKVASPV